MPLEVEELSGKACVDLQTRAFINTTSWGEQWRAPWGVGVFPDQSCVAQVMLGFSLPAVFPPAAFLVQQCSDLEFCGVGWNTGGTVLWKVPLVLLRVRHQSTLGCFLTAVPAWIFPSSLNWRLNKHILVLPFTFYTPFTLFLLWSSEYFPSIFVVIYFFYSVNTPDSY